MIDDKTFQSVLGMCRFSLNDTEKEKFRGQIGDILTYVEKLEAVDTSGIDPDLGKSLQPERLRQDTAAESLPQGSLEQLTPHFENGFFTVPQILEGMDE
ncbi:MAG: Asp-tRNA(Asn)/Glu-tRNA(Gln) amidotransferase subunit GatC [Spirochaetaceae bacterium]|nr:MAG: Asp-tRNA(Asn)/Glu-tRNA(Gln) amidotransferase subunit GatC [Spirochaetaceae bacterium]